LVEPMVTVTESDVPETLPVQWSKAYPATGMAVSVTDVPDR